MIVGNRYYFQTDNTLSTAKEILGYDDSIDVHRMPLVVGTGLNPHERLILHIQEFDYMMPSAEIMKYSRKAELETAEGLRVRNVTMSSFWFHVSEKFLAFPRVFEPFDNAFVPPKIRIDNAKMFEDYDLPSKRRIIEYALEDYVDKHMFLIPRITLHHHGVPIGPSIASAMVAMRCKKSHWLEKYITKYGWDEQLDEYYEFLTLSDRPNGRFSMHDRRIGEKSAVGALICSEDHTVSSLQRFSTPTQLYFASFVAAYARAEQWAVVIASKVFTDDEMIYYRAILLSHGFHGKKLFRKRE